MLNRYAFRSFALSLCALVLAAACGGNASVLPTQTPQSILDAASQRFSAIKSAHFSLSIDGDVFLDAGRTLALRSAEGDVARPNSASAKASIAFGGATISINMIAVGIDQYITNFLSGKWERAPQGLNYNPSILFDQQNGIQGVLKQAKGVSIVGNETVNGVKAFHLRGTVAKAAVAPMTGGAFQGDPIDFDLWVSQDSNDIVKIVLHDTAASQGATPAIWTLQITNQNAPVSITPPAD